MYTVTIYTHYSFLHPAVFHHHDLTTFFSHIREAQNGFNIPINLYLANIAAFCLGKLKTNHVLISKRCAPLEISVYCTEYEESGMIFTEYMLRKVRKMFSCYCL